MCVGNKKMIVSNYWRLQAPHQAFTFFQVDKLLWALASYCASTAITLAILLYISKDFISMYHLY